MKTIVVRYQAKPDRAAENQRLIEAVFAELDEREPEGFTYKVFRLEDGVSFIHVVIEHDVENLTPYRKCLLFKPSWLISLTAAMFPR